MKTIVTLLICLLSFNVIGQLNDNAEFLRDSIPNFYKPIKDYAVSEWGTDHEMVVYTINKQSDALFEFVHLYSENHDDVVNIALAEWCIEPDKIGKTESIYEIQFDWVMVVYQIKKQLKAKSSY